MRTLLAVALFAVSAFPVSAQDFKKENPDDPVVVMKTSMGDIYIELFAKEAPKTVKNFIGLAEGTKEFTDPKTKEKVKRPFYDGLIFHRVIANFMIQGGCPLGTGSGSPGFRFEDEINATSLGLDKLKAFEEKKGPHKWLGVRSQQQFYQVVVQPIFKKLGIKNKTDYEAKKKEVEKELAELTLKKCYENQGYKYSDTLKSHHPKKGVLAMANSGPNTNGSQFFINLRDTEWLTGKHTVFGKVVKGMDIVEKIGKIKVGDRSKPKEDVKILSIRLLKN